MKNYESVDLGCFSNKKELMANKEKYAKLFSEGRESLEQLLLTCYNNNIMSHACCSGHIIDDIYADQSYVHLRVGKRDLGIISSIIEEFKNSDLREICDIEQGIKTFSPFRDYFGFVIRTYFETADEVYKKITDIINNTDKKNISLEYEVLNYFKKELLEFRKRVLPKYSKDLKEASFVEIVQSGDLNEIHNYLKIGSIALQICPIDDEKRVRLEQLTKYINDHNDINYSQLIYAYDYEDDCELEDLKRVLLKKNK